MTVVSCLKGSANCGVSNVTILVAKIASGEKRALWLIVTTIFIIHDLSGSFLQPFSKITEMTEVQEGIIVRTIQRLHEILRDVCGVARVVGDTVLAQKLEEASTSIKRDIVFAGSLYLQ